MAKIQSLLSISLSVLAIVLAFLPRIRTDWRVTYKTLQGGVGDFTGKILSCGEHFMASAHSGFEISNHTMDCNGLSRNWTSAMQISGGSLYAVKSLVHDVYDPPLVLYNRSINPVPYGFQIPGILTRDTIITIVIQILDGLPKYTIILDQNTSSTEVSFRMRCLLGNTKIKFAHCVNGSSAVPPVDSLDMYPYSVDTPTTIEFLILDSVIQIKVDSSHFHNWTHRYPPSEFENVKIMVPDGGTHIYVHSVAVRFPDW